MHMIFLHGPPACGKLTVASALEARTGLPVFHNHLIVDALAPLFPFGSPAFVRLREEIWLAAFAAAAEEGHSFIFTFAPERTVRDGFADRVRASVEARGGNVRFVALMAADAVLAARVEDASRARHGKLRSRALLQELRGAGAFDVPPLPAELTLDTGVLSPEAAAARIAAALGLAAKG